MEKHYHLVEIYLEVGFSQLTKDTVNFIKVLSIAFILD